MFVRIALLMTLVALTGCSGYEMATKPSELRSEELAGDVQTVKVKASLSTVMDRITKKAKECMYYRVSFSGGLRNTYVPAISKKSKNKVTMVINLNRKLKNSLFDMDDSGIGLLVDVKALSNNLTKVTTYTWSGLDIADEFMDAVMSSAEGKSGPCPAEI